MPYAKNNTVSLDTGQNRLNSERFRNSIRELRENTIAEFMGLKAKDQDKADPTIVLKSLTKQQKKEWEDKLKKDWTHTGGHSADRIEVRDAFDVQYHKYYDDYKKVEKDKGNVKYMYHGTDFQAGSSIIKGGFKVMRRAKAGRLLGDGIYMAKSSSKVAQYLANGFTRSSGTGVILACRTAMGNVSPGDDRKDAFDDKYDTVYGKKGMAMGWGTLAHDEWCVKNPKAVVPVQWIDVRLK